MSRQPEVVTGARGPYDVRKAQAAAARASEPTQGPRIPEDEVWFQGSYARLRIQLTAPIPDRLPDGRVVRLPALVGQFEGAMLRLKKSKEEDAKKIELLRAHPQYGTLFWDFQDVLDQQDEDARTQVTTTLRTQLADPKQRKLILDALSAEGVDFVLPDAPASAEEGEGEPEPESEEETESAPKPRKGRKKSASPSGE